MNIAAIDVTTGEIVIACARCGQESAFVAADGRLLVSPNGQVVLVSPTCGNHLPGGGTCDRVTCIPRQGERDRADEWQWDHNRAMNAAVKAAIDKGAKFFDRVTGPERAAIVAERGKSGPRFPHEQTKDFGPGRGRVMSVDEQARQRSDRQAPR